ncbi:MAG: leucine--tRNA ligase [Phycisphaerales bacterium]|nr:leucine--tRNA ligase [Phycisphaerales bacterium]
MSHAAHPAPASGATPPAPPHRYTAQLANEIELRWQGWWEAHQTFEQPNPEEPGFDASKPKFYCLDMFPYPSGAGLHVGHPEGYTATDIICRARRMQGCNVLHPMGWDAFGLPAEQYAIQTGVHPAITTKKAIDNFRRQLKRFGFSYDWSREVSTIDPKYYKWTQWIWLRAYNSWFDPKAPNRHGGVGCAKPIGELVKLLESGAAAIDGGGNLSYVPKAELGIFGVQGGLGGGLRMWHELSPEEKRAFIDDQRLAYLAEQVVNWCPKLGTALANEEVIDGKSERGGFPVYRKPLRQWMFRITAYCERLLDGLDAVDWPESTRIQQREWIGRSEGAEIDFALDVPDEWGAEATSADGAPGALRVFTTRPDTVGGATYMVVAPEHALVEAVLADPRAETDAKALRAYVEQAKHRADVERQEAKEKTGVFTGVYAINPVTNARIPIWAADYVLMGYGTGAIMAVPAHDDRDYAFARAFHLPIRDVVYPRHVLAMKRFAQHATPDEQRDGDWIGVLADLLGYITSNDLGPDRFDDAIKTIRSRRRQDPRPGEAVALPPDQAPNEPGAIGQRRGVTKTQWLDLIEALGPKGFDDFKRRFDEARFYDHDGGAFTGHGYAVNTPNIEALPTAQAQRAVIAWFEEQGLGSRRINYKLRDWLFSRQRYWGEPFPIVFDERGDHHGVQASALPVSLPDLADYTPEVSDEPKPLLAKATDWINTTAGEAGVAPSELPAATAVMRESNTMPGWAGSCWYYLRYCDAHNADRFVGTEAEQYWMGSAPGQPAHSGGVDLYVGGAEHAVLHLLYARFWHKLLYDLGEVSTDEPFKKLYHQGLILSHAYQRDDRSLVPVDEVDESSEGQYIERATGKPVTQIVAKMSKSLRNVVNPDDIIVEFGADTFRLYEMYMGPLDASKPWNTRDTVGLFRLLQGIWRQVIDEQTGELTLRDTPDETVERQLHRTIAKVTSDIERLAFNTAIGSIFELRNAASKAGGFTGDQLDRFVRVIAPFAPHIAEELWSRLGKPAPVSLAPWPGYDETMLVDDQVEVAVQILGKVKAKIMAPTGADEKSLETAALADERIVKLLEGKTVRKVIVVPGRLVNIVAN